MLAGGGYFIHTSQTFTTKNKIMKAAVQWNRRRHKYIMIMSMWSMWSVEMTLGRMNTQNSWRTVTSLRGRQAHNTTPNIKILGMTGIHNKGIRMHWTTG